jgi:hypothetical protein
MKGGAHVFADIPAQQRTEYISDKIPLELSYSALGIEMKMAEYCVPLTHSWSSTLLEKPPIVQVLINFPAFYGN